MQNTKYTKIIALALVFALALAVTGCGMRRPVAENGKPIEPLAPGGESAEMQVLQGHFAVRASDVGIQDLSVTDDGALTVVGTAAKSIYLLERGGKLRWEMTLDSEPLQTYIDSTGTFIYVGTAGGKLLFLDANQTDRAQHQFDAPVGLLSLSADGELILAGIQSEDKTQSDKMVILDKAGYVQWELSVDKLLDARFAGYNKQVYVNWLDNEESVFAAFSASGEKRWEVRERIMFAVDENVQTLVSTNGDEIFGYNRETDLQWRYPTSEAVSQLILAETGSHLGVLVIEEETRNEEMIYLSAEGRELWRKRLPAESEIVISSDGARIIVASWRQYRDEATQVFIYNEHGEEVNVLEVAGRAQKMALAGDAATLVLGLEDGTIYFLNVTDPVRGGEPMEDRTLLEYYSPVDFGRDDGESRLTLFFFDENAQTLIPVTRRVKRSKPLLQASVEELIRGPIQGSFLHRPIPKDSQIKIHSHDGVVQIDLPASLDEMAGSTFLTGVIDSLLMTVSQFPRVEQILFTIEEEPRETFGAEGLFIAEPYTSRRLGRNVGERLVYLPARSGEKYYLSAQSKSVLLLKDKALIKTLVNDILVESQSFFMHDLELQDVRIENNRVLLNFSESFNAILADNVEAAARAAMLRDALALTIVENAYYSNLEILVNGNPPSAPKIYLPWEISIIRPYYVNLEY